MPEQPEKTTFSRDVIGRFSCNTWDEATTDPDSIDVVVLGSGMYGGYCASKIYELSRQRFAGKSQPLRVVVLEAGPSLIPEHGQNIPNFGLNDPGIFNSTETGSGANSPTRNLVWGVGWRSNQAFVGQAYCLGGKGIYWGGWCPRFQDSDLAHWPAETREYLQTVDPSNPVGRRPIGHSDPATGKMLHRDEPLSAYETLEYEIGVQPADDFVFDPTRACACDTSKVGLNKGLYEFLNKRRTQIDSRITQVLMAPIAVQTQSLVSGLFSLDKYSSLPALVGSARADHGDGRQINLRMSIVPFAHVVRLECAGSPESPTIGTRVVNAIVVKHEGQFKRLEIQPHCQVVIAMSCIESTRLALESFSLVDSALRPAGDELMGRNFMVHLRCDITFDVERAKLAEFIADTFTGKTLADFLQLAALHIQCEGQHGRYQYQLFAATNANGPDANMYRMVPDLDVQRQIADQFDADMIRLVLRASGEVEGGRNATLGDSSFDCIDLAGDADFDKEFNHRRAWVQFNRGAKFNIGHFEDGAWKDIHDTGHAIANELANGGALVYRGGPYFLDSLKVQQGVGTTFHDSGTLWMGDHPDSSVTDPNGHFHHVVNAYCCDQALFTTIGSANPVLTGLCLARKVADDIVSRHESYAAGPGEFSEFVNRSLNSSQGWLQEPYHGMTDIAGDIIETDPHQGIGLYYLPQTFTNFELAVEWKAFRTYGSNYSIPNSGILLRMPDPAQFDFSNPAAFDQFYNSVTEVQIDETGKNFEVQRFPQAIFGDSRFKTGAVYGVAPAIQWAAKMLAPDDPNADRYWNFFHIVADGNQVGVSLNGRLVCQTALPAHKQRSGFIGFQFHTGRVQFRNLKLKMLPG